MYILDGQDDVLHEQCDFIDRENNGSNPNDSETDVKLINYVNRNKLKWKANPNFAENVGPNVGT